MLVVSRFTVDDEGQSAFMERARAALAAFAARPGYRGGRIGRAVDDPSAYLLATGWDGVGAYRRALSAYDVKVHAHPLLAAAHPGPAAFEVLYADGPGAAAVEEPSRRAGDAATVRVGEAAGPAVPPG